jgi:hypothetical protein
MAKYKPKLFTVPKVKITDILNPGEKIFRLSPSILSPVMKEDVTEYWLSRSETWGKMTEMKTVGYTLTVKVSDVQSFKGFMETTSDFERYSVDECTTFSVDLFFENEQIDIARICGHELHCGSSGMDSNPAVRKPCCGHNIFFKDKMAGKLGKLGG